jgi:hypothetical protein
VLVCLPGIRRAQARSAWRCVPPRALGRQWRPAAQGPLPGGGIPQRRRQPRDAVRQQVAVATWRVCALRAGSRARGECHWARALLSASAWTFCGAVPLLFLALSPSLLVRHGCRLRRCCGGGTCLWGSASRSPPPCSSTRTDDTARCASARRWSARRVVAWTSSWTGGPARASSVLRCH